LSVIRDDSERGEALRTGKAILRGFLLCFLAFLGVHRAGGQIEPSQPPVQAVVTSEPSIMRADKPREGLIHLDVAATDREGKPFSGLTAKDFMLLDNGVPQKIISFAASNEAADENERLIEVVLVLDEVDLSPVQFELVKNESIKFLRQNSGHLALLASVYWFTTSGLYASANPTTDGNVLAEDVAHHRLPRTVWAVPRNQHSLSIGEAERYARWDRARKAVYSIAVERRDRAGRKLLVWMGFGWPGAGGLYEDKNTAFSSLVELSTRIREARMVISQVTARTEPAAFTFIDPYKDYLAGVRTPSGLVPTAPSELGEPGVVDPYLYFSLPVLAIQSGGLVLDPVSDIARAIEQCVEDARVFYTVSFDPPHAAKPDEYHDLKMQMETYGLSARTNIGYYNQPVYYDQPRVPTRRVTVQELEQMLGATVGEHDGELAGQLAGLELSERLSSPRLSLWQDRLRGKKSKAALTALGDSSAFLDPPEAEIPRDPAPDLEAQRQMLSRTVKYLRDVIPRLPDFFAVRTTTQYEQLSPKEGNSWKTALADQSLREAVTEKATLRYRNGHEEQDVEKKTGSRSAKKKDLNFIGAFGPILGSVLVDATGGDSRLIWSRWAQGDRGREAVFRYIVRGDNPRYTLVYCCLVGGEVFRVSTKYLGELAIDPATGAILRLTMESEPGWIREPNLQPVLPVKDASMMVEYGPVEIGGRTYVCPRRSVVIMRARNIRTLAVWDQTFDIYTPYETLLNDMVYTDYHRFGSESRMLPGFDVMPDATPSPAVNGQTPTPPPNR
jgi:VWFA-related protein